MTKAEEKAIECLKIVVSDINECGVEYYIDEEILNDIETILNLAEKQCKKIDENNKYKLYYKEVNKKYIPKDRLKILKKKIKQYSKEANKQIEESVVIADNDSLNYGRMQAHETDISLIDKMLEE